MRTRGATLVEYSMILMVSIFMIGAAYKGLGMKVAASAKRATAVVTSNATPGSQSESSGPMAPLMTTGGFGGPGSFGSAPVTPGPFGGGGAGVGLGSQPPQPTPQEAPPSTPSPEDLGKQIEQQKQKLNDMSEMLHREHEERMDLTRELS